MLPPPPPPKPYSWHFPCDSSWGVGSLMRKAFPCRGEIFISFHEQRDSDVGCVKSSPWRKQSHFSWQKLCMFYRVTCSFRVFLGGNYIHSWNISSCCCFDSPACIQFSCQLSRLIWTSSPALYITVEIPVQLQSLSLIKKRSICDLPLFFIETLYSFGDYLMASFWWL